MEFVSQKIADVILITPKIFEDDRGFFLETYSRRVFMENGINVDFIQDNHSFSKQGVLRGMHFQKPPMAQDKLIRVVTGEVFDVAVDLRRDSPTFKKWIGVVLSGDNKKILYVPKGFAHGFLTLSETAHFEYKVSNYYSPEYDSGFLWNDPDIGIEWPRQNHILNGKDSKLSFFKELKNPF